MSEAVHVGTNPADPSKPFLQPALAIKPLSDEGLPSGQETVRLNKPASRKLPPPLFHTLSDFLKHVGKNFFDPLKEGRGGGGKPEIRKFLHSVQHGGIGGLHLLHSLFPAPEPDRIDMRISYHIQCLFLHFISPCPALLLLIPYKIRIQIQSCHNSLLIQIGDCERMALQIRPKHGFQSTVPPGDLQNIRRRIHYLHCAVKYRI